jgi:hypothetical protein
VSRSVLAVLLAAICGLVAHWWLGTGPVGVMPLFALTGAALLVLGAKWLGGFLLLEPGLVRPGEAVLHGKERPANENRLEVEEDGGGHRA